MNLEVTKSTVCLPKIKNVLQQLRNSAANSLHGPSDHYSMMKHYFEAMKSLGDQSLFPFVPSVPGESGPYNGYKYNNAEGMKPSFVPAPGCRLFPILTPPDQTANEYTTTLLHDCVIPCFVIGGEKRLCMPKILVSVLKDFSLGDINSVLDELQIYCSRCTPAQLTLLKKLDVIPRATPSCGLITKTDAERLVSALLDKQQQQQQPTATRVNFKNISSLTSPSTDSHIISTSTSNKNNQSAKNNTDKSCKKDGFTRTGIAIRIHHNCFGKCTGIYRPSMYTSHDAPCIECTTCSGLFSPSKFVCHTHKARNSRTCHWGFDSKNWRSYLVLLDHADDAQSQEVLDNMKSKFQPLEVERSSPAFYLAPSSACSLLHSNKSPALLGLPSPQQMQQPQPKISSSLEEHLDQQHHKDPLLPPHPKRFKSSSASPVTLTCGLRSILDSNAIDKALQSKILDEVDLIIQRVKSQI